MTEYIDLVRVHASDRRSRALSRVEDCENLGLPETHQYYTHIQSPLPLLFLLPPTAEEDTGHVGALCIDARGCNVCCNNLDLIGSNVDPTIPHYGVVLLCVSVSLAFSLVVFFFKNNLVFLYPFVL